MWKLSDFKLIKSMKLHQNVLSDIKINDDLIYTAGHDGKIIIMSCENINTNFSIIFIYYRKKY